MRKERDKDKDYDDLRQRIAELENTVRALRIIGGVEFSLLLLALTALFIVALEV